VTGQFVILEHAAPAGVHWDLLLELTPGAELAAWRLAGNPLLTPSQTDAVRLPPHRRRYLDFEGALSGGRGVVRRLDRGRVRIQEHTAERVIAELRGAKLHGVARLAAEEEGWRFSLEQAE
jgi:hypothetical protein